MDFSAVGGSLPFLLNKSHILLFFTPQERKGSVTVVGWLSAEGSNTSELTYPGDP